MGIGVFVFSFFSETPLALLGTCRKEGRSPLRPYSAPGSAGMEIVCWEGREGDGTADRAAPANSPDLLCAPGCRVPWVSPPGEVWILLNGLWVFFPSFLWACLQLKLCGAHPNGTSLFCALGSDMSLEQQNSRFLVV